MTNIALEIIPAGYPVCSTEEGVRVASYAEMNGVARRPANGTNEFQPGEEVSIRTDGGILTILPEPLEFTGGRYTGQAYLRLQNGRITNVT